MNNILFSLLNKKLKYIYFQLCVLYVKEKGIAGRFESLSFLQEIYVKDLCTKNKLSFKTYTNPFGKRMIIFSERFDICEALFCGHVGLVGVDDTTFGNIYGYPQCCIQSVLHTGILIEDSPEKEIKYIARHSNEGRYPAYMNFFSDYRLFQHIPCSLECKKTIEIAESKMEILSKIVNRYDFKRYTKKLTKKYFIEGKKIIFI